MSELLPLFLNLTGRSVVLVGGGRGAAGKLRQLVAVSADVTMVAPEISDEIKAWMASPVDRVGDESERPLVRVIERAFEPADLDGAWLVVAAAPPEVNRLVAAAAEARRLFVNAVDDPTNATAYLSGVVRRDGVTIAISTSGDAPALTALLREGLDALLPRDLSAWIARARAERVEWRRDDVPIDERKPRLLKALNAMYGTTPDGAAGVPWLNAPEDSWL